MQTKSSIRLVPCVPARFTRWYIVRILCRRTLPETGGRLGSQVRIGELQDRLKNFETRFAAKKGLICKVMERADIKKIKEPDFTASLRPKNPALVVMNEADIPEDYWRPQAPKLDKQALIRDL